MDYHRVIDYGRNKEMQGAIEKMPWISPIGFIAAVFFFFFTFGNYEYDSMNRPIPVSGMDLIMGKEIAPNPNNNYRGFNDVSPSKNGQDNTIFRTVQFNGKDLMRKGASKGNNALNQNNQNNNNSNNGGDNQGYNDNYPYNNNNNNQQQNEDNIWNDIENEMGRSSNNQNQRNVQANVPIIIEQNMWVILALLLSVVGILMYFLPMPRQKFLFCAIAGVFGFLILMLFRQTAKIEVQADPLLRSIDFQFGFMGALMCLLAAGIANGVLFKATPEPTYSPPEDDYYDNQQSQNGYQNRPPTNRNYPPPSVKDRIIVRKRRDGRRRN